MMARVPCQAFRASTDKMGPLVTPLAASSVSLRSAPVSLSNCRRSLHGPSSNDPASSRMSLQAGSDSLRSMIACRVCGKSFHTHHNSKALDCPTCSTRALHTDSQYPKDPMEALQKLRDGNKRFVRGEIRATSRSVEALQKKQGAQAPIAAILACADSQVPVEVIFDQGFGDVFITRVAGNIVTTEIIASLEFGTAYLGSKVLYVLGHTHCTAVTATAENAVVSGVISSLYYMIRPACRRVNNNVEEAIKQNVRMQALTLAISPVISGLVAANKLVIVGGVYDLMTGMVNEIPLEDEKRKKTTEKKASIS